MFEVEDVHSESESSVRSTRSTRSNGNPRPIEGDFFQLDLKKVCGKVFHPTSRGGLGFVCLQSPPCRKQHKQEDGKGIHGGYYRAEASYGRHCDGRLDSFLTSEEYTSVRKKNSVNTLQALADFAAEKANRAHNEVKAQEEHGIKRGEKEGSPTVSLAANPKEELGTPSSLTISTATGSSASSKGSGLTSKKAPPTGSAKEREDTKTEGISELLAAVSQLAKEVQVLKSHQNTTTSSSEGAPAPESKTASKGSSKGEKKKRNTKKKKKSRKSSRKYSSSSSSSSSESSSEYPSSDGSEVTHLPSFWYAVLWGKGGVSTVLKDRAAARKLLVKGQSLYRRCLTEQEGWEFINSHLGRSGISTPPADPPRGFSTGSVPEEKKEETRPPVDPSMGRSGEPGDSPGVDPPMPPLSLSGSDPSLKKEEEVFGIDLDCDTNELRKKLAPPGVSPQMARDLGETLLDAVSLPGRSGVATETEDTASNIEASLAELAAIQRQEALQDDIRRDLKWNNASRNALRLVKNESDLRTMLEDVLQLQDRALKTVLTNQRTILLRLPWSKEAVEAWSFGGYISRISRLSVTHYISFLHHLVLVSMKNGWDLAKQEIDHYVKRFNLIRANSQARIVALCRVYVLLRDGAESSWRSNKLEAEKITYLYQQIQAAKDGAPSKEKEKSVTSKRGEVCPRCGTTLHSVDVTCPWSHLGKAKAQKEGRNALKALAKNGGGAGESSEG